MMTDSEKKMLTRLQRGIEIVSQPFSESELTTLKTAQSNGLLRRFGGVFDARRLGYKSMLCALDVANELLEEKAAIVSAHPGVTHCYERRPLDGDGGYPSLWFTLSMLQDEFDAGWERLCSELETDGAQLYPLPALRRFKIDVVFDLHNRNRDETFPGRKTAPEENELFRVFSGPEKDLVRALDQQMPLVEQPFAAVAEQIGLSEAWVLSTLKEWKEQGALRRIGAILYHREAGFKANAMCVWPMDRDRVLDAGARVAGRPEVTHCYQRPRLDAFPFDLYAMIHTGSWEETRALFMEISESCGLSGGELFASGREFKKSSMQYFR